MAFKDLREFIDLLESRGMLKRITAEVDCELEITEITDRVSKMEGDKNVALLFENVKGYDIPVLMNAFGSMERMAMALGVEKLDDVAEGYGDLQETISSGRNRQEQIMLEMESIGSCYMEQQDSTGKMEEIIGDMKLMFSQIDIHNENV